MQRESISWDDLVDLFADMWQQENELQIHPRRLS